MTIEASRRKSLPQLTGTGLFVTDGGLETELIFHDGLDLPCFAAFPLLENPDTRVRLRRYYDGYLAIAREHDAGFIVETPTWRANPDWAGQLGYSPEQLDAANRAAVSLAEEVRLVAAADGITAVVSGCIGPRGDGYDPGSAMTPEEAERYHAVQIDTFATTTADQVTALTMTNVEEAIGIVRAASERAFRRRSPSRSRPTVGFPRASRCVKRSSRWTPRPAPAPRISWSTAPTPLTSRMHWQPMGRGCEGSSACGRTHRRGAMPSSTRRPSSTRATRSTSAPGTPHCVTDCPPSRCSAAAAARTPGMWQRSSRRGAPTRLLRVPALDAIADWPVKSAAAAVIAPSGVLAQYGDTSQRFALASVTKPLAARAAQIAIEEGVVELDTEAGPPGQRSGTCSRTPRGTRCTHRS